MRETVALRETTVLPAIEFSAPPTFAEAARVGPSSIGNSAVGAWLSCPQYSHLNGMGIEQKPSEHSDYGLNALQFGTLFHLLRAARLVQGQQAAEDILRRYSLETREVGAEDAQRILLLLRVYDQLYPVAAEPFDVLGVEVEVLTNIKDWWGRPLFRSVRYDTVIRMKSDGAIFSLECKTMSRSGQSSLNAYIPQGMVHSAIWNNNTSLVAQYGHMQGSIWDCAVKTTNPKCERVGPRYFTTIQQEMAKDYLRLPEVIQMPRLPDGSFPKFFHTCWGRWSPCKYIGLCHEGTYGDYVIVDKESGEMLPYFPDAY